MSIHTTLTTCTKHGRLFAVQPMLGGDIHRHVYATPEVYKELDPDTASRMYIQNAAQLRAWIDGFIIGRAITVGDGKCRHSDIKILDPAQDEVWELRKRESPSTRIFGRFAEKDIFIATNIKQSGELFAKRWTIGGAQVWPVWKTEIRRCKSTWDSLFPAHNPLSGENVHVYITNAIDERKNK